MVSKSNKYSYTLLKDQSGLDHWHSVILSPCYVYLIKHIPANTYYYRVVESIGITGGSDISFLTIAQIFDSHRLSPRYPILSLYLKAHLAAERYLRNEVLKNNENWELAYLSLKKFFANFTTNYVSAHLRIFADAFNNTRGNNSD